MTDVLDMYRPGEIYPALLEHLRAIFLSLSPLMNGRHLPNLLKSCVTAVVGSVLNL